jgi:hypothetical protein
VTPLFWFIVIVIIFRMQNAWKAARITDHLNQLYSLLQNKTAKVLQKLPIKSSAVSKRKVNSYACFGHFNRAIKWLYQNDCIMQTHLTLWPPA